MHHKELEYELNLQPHVLKLKMYTNFHDTIIICNTSCKVCLASMRRCKNRKSFCLTLAQISTIDTTIKTNVTITATVAPSVVVGVSALSVPGCVPVLKVACLVETVGPGVSVYIIIHTYKKA